MALLEIRTAPDSILKQKAVPVETVDDALRQTLENMLETMYQANGIGLAGPQVGISQRILVMDLDPEGSNSKPMKVINPEITWVSDEDSDYREGCLSVPEHYAKVVRPAEVKVAYLDENGNSQEMHATGLLATCVQHEIDHLDGILFIDHVSALKRNLILRKLLKAKKMQAL